MKSLFCTSSASVSLNVGPLTGLLVSNLSKCDTVCVDDDEGCHPVQKCLFNSISDIVWALNICLRYLRVGYIVVSKTETINILCIWRSMWE